MGVKNRTKNDMACGDGMSTRAHRVLEFISQSNLHEISAINMDEGIPNEVRCLRAVQKPS